MKQFLAAFTLTRAEQRLVIFVVLLLVAAAFLKHHRDIKYEAQTSPSAAVTPVMSPSPGDQ